LDLPESIVAAHGKIVEDAFSALAAAASPAAEAGGAREARTAAFEEAAKAVERLECVWCTDGICLPEGPAQTRAFQAAAQTIRNLASRPEAPTDGQ
jgi:cytochrome c556